MEIHVRKSYGIYVGICIYWILANVQETSNSNSSIGFCPKNGNSQVCCDNYFRKDGVCKACANGTYGKNCSQKCPLPRFGLLCERLCNCSLHEECNAVLGCICRMRLKNGKCNDFIQDQQLNSTNYGGFFDHIPTTWTVLSLVLLGVVVICPFIGIIVHCKRQKKSIKGSLQDAYQHSGCEESIKIRSVHLHDSFNISGLCNIFISETSLEKITQTSDTKLSENLKHKSYELVRNDIDGNGESIIVDLDHGAEQCNTANIQSENGQKKVSGVSAVVHCDKLGYLKPIQRNNDSTYDYAYT